MILTKEFVDSIAPEHGRTSCSDTNLSNGFGGWEGTYNEKTGEKVIRYPRCIRCYLLCNLGMDTKDLDFEINRTISLEFKENV